MPCRRRGRRGRPGRRDLRGAAGREGGRERRPLTPDTHFRIMSMTKMVCTVAALQLIEKGSLDLDAPVETYRPEFADVQVLDGWDGDTPRCAPRPPGDGEATGHTHLGPRLLVLERGPGQVGGRPPAPPTSCPARTTSSVRRWWPTRARVRLRDQHRLARQGRRDRGRGRAGRGDQGRHHRTARHGRDHVPVRRGLEGRRPRPPITSGTTAAGSTAGSTRPAPRVLRRRSRAVLDAERVHPLPAGAAAETASSTARAS